MEDRLAVSVEVGYAFPSGPEEENFLTVILGIMDAGALGFVFRLDGIDMDRGYLKRSLERVENGLNFFLNRQDEVGKNFGLCEIALLCG